MSLLFLVAAVLAQSPAACTADGKPWQVGDVNGLVVTNPLLGRRLSLNVYDAGKAQLPYLQISAAWKGLERGKNVKVGVKNATPKSPLEAMWTATAPGPLLPPDFEQAGLHFLEQGELLFVGFDASASTVTLTFEGTLREGSPRNPKAHVVKMKCSFNALKVNVSP
ncbi:MAG: hypothetical protein Q8S33_09075 [Myxococcales bacterium]|nr:hypothetical protein [Myxococcales bacterium]MDP3500473.1 hypothetical protein [Myxococcales bacterium]